MPARFIQIHFLTAYPGALLNRDDAGFAKRLPFGGATRTRVSSQCLKRHWRTFDGKGALAELSVPGTVRSRETFERRIVQPLVEEGHEYALANEVAWELQRLVFGQSKKSKAKGGDTAEPVHTEQITVLGEPELDHLRGLARRVLASLQDGDDLKQAVKDVVDKEEQKNLKALAKGAGLGAALFGRMVTSDILARCDAAVHVAHAFTVHAEDSEPDYFSAVDDLVREDGALGSGHIGNTELTSGLFYGYVVVDVELLVSNLAGDRVVAAEVIAHLVRLIATVSPGAKKGSTAPYAYALAMLAEAGDAQPRTLANAFLKPVVQSADVRADAYGALAHHLRQLDAVYETGEARRVIGLDLGDALRAELGAEDAGSLSALSAWAGAQVAGTA